MAVFTTCWPQIQGSISSTSSFTSTLACFRFIRLDTHLKKGTSHGLSTFFEPLPFLLPICSMHEQQNMQCSVVWFIKGHYAKQHNVYWVSWSSMNTKTSHICHSEFNLQFSISFLKFFIAIKSLAKRQKCVKIVPKAVFCCSTRPWLHCNYDWAPFPMWVLFEFSRFQIKVSSKIQWSAAQKPGLSYSEGIKYKGKHAQCNRCQFNLNCPSQDEYFRNYAAH